MFALLLRMPSALRPDAATYAAKPPKVRALTVLVLVVGVCAVVFGRMKYRTLPFHDSLLANSAGD
jgi:hypothetical protein